MVTVDMPSDVEALAHCAGWNRAQVAALEPAWAQVTPARSGEDEEVRRYDRACRAVRAEQVAAVWESASGVHRGRLLERFAEGTSRPHRWSSASGAVGTGFGERALYAWSGVDPAARGHLYDGDELDPPRGGAGQAAAMSADVDWTARLEEAKHGKVAATRAYEATVRDAHRAGRSISAIARDLGIKDRTGVTAIIGRGEDENITLPVRLPPVVLLIAAALSNEALVRVTTAIDARGWYLTASSIDAWHLARAGATVVLCDLSRTSEGQWGDDGMRLGRVRARVDESADPVYGDLRTLELVTGGITTRPYTGALSHQVLDAPALAALIGEHFE